MRIVLQRVKEASVEVNHKIISKINQGLLLLIGIGKETDESKIPFMAKKIVNLRIFEDEKGKFNLSALDIKAEVLAISQFTLYANCKKGRRPDFFDSADPQKGEELYLKLVNELKKSGLTVETGEFGAKMSVSLINDGPVTIIF